MTGMLVPGVFLGDRVGARIHGGDRTGDAMRAPRGDRIEPQDDHAACVAGIWDSDAAVMKDLKRFYGPAGGMVASVFSLR